MDNNIQKAIRYFREHERELCNLSLGNVIAIYKDSVEGSFDSFEEAFVDVFIESFHKNRDFMDYFFYNKDEQTFLGGTHILWKRLSH